MKGIIFTLFFVAGNVESVNIGDNFGARFRLMKNKYNENKKFYMNDINSIYNLVSNSTLKSRPCYHYSDNNVKKTVRVNYKIAKKYSNLFLNK